MQDSKTTNWYDRLVHKMYETHCPRSKVIEDPQGQYWTYFPPMPWWLSLMIRIQEWLA